MSKHKPEKFLNWSEISLFLAGSTTSIMKKRIPKIHQKKIDDLLNRINDWQEEYQKDKDIS